MTLREQIGTVVVASVFALLIWLWAEGENRRTDSLSVTIRFAVAGDDSRHLVRAKRPGDPGAASANLAVRLELEGPNLLLQRMMSGAGAYTILVDEPNGSLEREISIREELQNLPAFADAGITIVSAAPARVALKFDEIIQQSIRVNTQIPGFDVAQVKVDPDRAMVTMPRETMNFVMQKHGDAFLRLDLPPSLLRQMSAGETRVFESVNLRLDSALETDLAVAGTRDSVRIDAEPVRVEVTLSGAANVEESIAVPVTISTPLREERNYDVVVDLQFELIPDVVVTGPPALISRLRSGELKVVARLDFTSDELEQAITRKRIEWQAPEGISVRVKDRDPAYRPEIPVTIVRRQPEQS